MTLLSLGSLANMSMVNCLTTLLSDRPSERAAKTSQFFFVHVFG